MVPPNARLLLGVGTGLVALVAMVRLVAGAFNGSLSGFAWVFLLAAMVPWVGYAAWRARRGRLTRRAALALLLLVGVAAVTTWLSTWGAVLALACSLTGFALIWVADWPPRTGRGVEEFVRIEELTADDED